MRILALFEIINIKLTFRNIFFMVVIHEFREIFLIFHCWLKKYFLSLLKCDKNCNWQWVLFQANANKYSYLPWFYKKHVLYMQQVGNLRLIVLSISYEHVCPHARVHTFTYAFVILSIYLFYARIATSNYFLAQNLFRPKKNMQTKIFKTTNSQSHQPPHTSIQLQSHGRAARNEHDPKVNFGR